jgi:hypothetical protein
MKTGAFYHHAYHERHTSTRAAKDAGLVDAEGARGEGGKAEHVRQSAHVTCAREGE